MKMKRFFFDWHPLRIWAGGFEVFWNIQHCEFGPHTLIRLHFGLFSVAVRFRTPFHGAPEPTFEPQRPAKREKKPDPAPNYQI